MRGQAHQLLAGSGGRKRYEPDYYAFVIYAFVVLNRVKIRFPNAEKVDFIVERKSSLTTHIQEFYESLPTALKHVNREDLLPLMGDFIPAAKERVPLQAADFLCWHSRRADARMLDETDMRRWNPMAKKKGFNFTAPERLMASLAEAFTARSGGK